MLLLAVEPDEESGQLMKGDGALLYTATTASTNTGGGVLFAPRRNSVPAIHYSERAQDLGGVVQRLSSGSIATPDELRAFADELRGLHLSEAEEVVNMFESNFDSGLSFAQVESRLATDGANAVFPPAKVRPAWKKFVLSFFSGWGPLLWVAAAFVLVSWRPLGTPPKNAYNLALAIVLFVVIFTRDC